MLVCAALPSVAASPPQIGDDSLGAFWVAFTTGLLFAGTPFVLAYMHSLTALQVRFFGRLCSGCPGSTTPLSMMFSP